MKSILKVCSALLLTFALVVGFAVPANADNARCDLINNFFCPSVSLNAGDSIQLGIPGNKTINVSISPFEPSEPYIVQYNFGRGTSVEAFVGPTNFFDQTGPFPSPGYFLNRGPQTINVELSHG
ncbi:MAG: hypothetical protein J7647_07425 [Cyanobacteria bacterium SBLK]|nr:hypothetical protein [Cyanobacteria bacterium SBLK]